MRKRNYAGLVTFIIFLLVVVATAGAVVYFGTKTGMQLGGKAVVTGVADTAKSPFYAQTGWIRNNSPWPVTITGVSVNGKNFAGVPEVYLVDQQPAAPSSGKKPSWATTPLTLPLTLPGSKLYYLGFGVTAADGQVASFTTVTLTFKGPLPLSFTTSESDVVVATQALDLPVGLVATDPAASPDSLDAYIVAVRNALHSHNPDIVQNTMGPGTTKQAASAFLKSQKGYKTAFNVQALAVNQDPTTQSLVFYDKKPANGLGKFTAHWSDYRWSITLDKK
ncbi:MAG: hypothetical protein JWR53_600 [Glaciihabitans sp.]|jgi:hypothetical protein|nr:hypothetical protein [Glaciihabitans sp.]MCU1534119.1 hypothetical protein [Glaciihabitans sp.]